MADALLRAEYAKVKQLCSADWKSTQAGDAILKLVTISLRFLGGQCQPIDLISKVPGKRYFTFKKGDVVARPANSQFFLGDRAAITKLWKQWLSDRISPDDFAKLSYTVALAPCLAMEIFDRQNKKGPATYFECYIGHLFAKSLGVNPTKRVRLPVHGRDVLMTMDFLIDMGKNHRKVHLPVKMSTRERVVQAWAHQRLLDAAYGNGTYRIAGSWCYFRRPNWIHGLTRSWKSVFLTNGLPISPCWPRWIASTTSTFQTGTKP